MRNLLKPLYQQVIIIVGVLNRGGEAVLKSAVRRGAKVFMIDESEEGLQLLQDEMRVKGYDTAFAVANLEEKEQLSAAIDRCLMTFGEVHSWINLFQLPNRSEFSRYSFNKGFAAVTTCFEMASSCLALRGGALINVLVSEGYYQLKRDVIFLSSINAADSFFTASRKRIERNNPQIKVCFMNYAQRSHFNTKRFCSAILNFAEEGLTRREKFNMAGTIALSYAVISLVVAKLIQRDKTKLLT